MCVHSIFLAITLVIWCFFRIWFFIYCFFFVFLCATLRHLLNRSLTFIAQRQLTFSPSLSLSLSLFVTHRHMFVSFVCQVCFTTAPESSFKSSTMVEPTTRKWLHAPHIYICIYVYLSWLHDWLKLLVHLFCTSRRLLTTNTLQKIMISKCAHIYVRVCVFTLCRR